MSGSWQETYEHADDLRALDLLRRWGVDSLAEKEFARLSEGERKRVLIARALMSNPELLILDEPGASLDLAGREDLVSRLDAFARSADSPSMVLVTHHVEEIPPSFTHALVLRDGGVLALGPIELVMTSAVLSEAFAMPLHVQRVDGRYTARSMSS
jgi:iron complex transport system ATP-binding protein